MLPMLLMIVQAPTAALPLENCTGVTTRADGEVLGDRAIVSPAGDRFVLECGDGSILAWNAGKIERLTDTSTLFDVARQRGLIPAWAECPKPDGQSTRGRVVDQASDESAMIVVNSLSPFVLRRGHPPIALSFQFIPGTFSGGSQRIWVADDRDAPGRLGSMAIGDTTPKAVASFPDRNLLFEDGEGRATAVQYAQSPNLLVISFGGAFRVAPDMAMLRAYDRAGRQRWSFRAALPSRDGSLIVGEYPALFVLQDGAMGAMRRTSNRAEFELLDLASGKMIRRLPGWPIAVSASGSVVLVRTGPERVEVRTIDVIPS